MIVDVHAHLGFDEVFDHDFTESELIESQEANAIDVTLVQPSLVHDLEAVKRYHDAIADLAARFAGRFYGMANPNPHLPGDEYEKEVRRCVGDLKFVGVKLHPFAHGVNPVGRHGRRVFALAAELDVPVMVHTGAGIPWSAPALMASVAREHPDLRIVLAHSGAMILAGEAIAVAREHENVYLEASWTGGFLVRGWVKELGAGRVMFGSDHADNAATELVKFRSIGLTEGELALVLGGAAELDVPVMVHTGAGIPWAAPALMAQPAREHPDLKIVLAHSGAMILAGEAIDLAGEHGNVYLEASWTGGFLVKDWTREIGAGRVMFGSDHADNAATELVKFRSTGLTEAELSLVLGGTAAKVYRIRDKQEAAGE